MTDITKLRPSEDYEEQARALVMRITAGYLDGMSRRELHWRLDRVIDLMVADQTIDEEDQRGLLPYGFCWPDGVEEWGRAGRADGAHLGGGQA